MYAHIKDDCPGQTIQDHSYGLYEIAADQIDRIKFPVNFTQNMKTIIEILAQLHDIGKYSEAWQKYLQTHDMKDWRDHKSLAPQVLARKVKMSPYLSRLLQQVLQGHHAGLKNAREPGSIVEKVREFHIEEYYNIDWEKIIREEGLDFRQLDKAMTQLAFSLDLEPWSLQILTRLFHSLIVDGDFCDTERYMSPESFATRGHYDPMSVLVHRLTQYRMRHFKDRTSNLNILREEIYQQCHNMGVRTQAPTGVFSLEAPTGSGKTISSMAFALNHAISHDKQRVIIVLPYLSIIDQNAKVLRHIFGSHNVVEQHGNLVMEDSNKTNPLDAENWEAPIVITTGVQFFESLFTNSPSRNRKFHNIMNSVIVIDEVQSLPFHMLEGIMKTVESLVKYYGCSFVFCSATVPDFGLNPIPIIHNAQKYYEIFEGRYENHIEPQQTFESLKSRVSITNQVLIVVNRRLTAQTLFRFLERDRKNVFCLTTLKKPLHRLNDIRKIKKLIEAGEPCTVVSTSLIEAGVDLDFPEVWREQAGLGNYVQTQGRCNRHFKRDMGHFHIFSFRDLSVPTYLTQVAELTDTYLRMYGDNFSNFEKMKVFYTAWRIKNKDKTDTEGLIPLLYNKEYSFQFHMAAKSSRVIKQLTKEVVVCELDEYGKPFEMDEILTNPNKKRAVALLGRMSIQLYENDFTAMVSEGLISTAHWSEIPYLSDPSIYDADLGIDLIQIKNAKNNAKSWNL